MSMKGFCDQFQLPRQENPTDTLDSGKMRGEEKRLEPVFSVFSLITYTLGPVPSPSPRSVHREIPCIAPGISPVAEGWDDILGKRTCFKFFSRPNISNASQ